MRRDIRDLFQQVDRELEATLETNLQSLWGICLGVFLFKEPSYKVKEASYLFSDQNIIEYLPPSWTPYIFRRKGYKV